MAALPAAEAPALAYFAIGLLAMVAFLVALGLRVTWEYTLGYLLNVIADALDFRVLGRAVRLGGPVRRANRAVLNALHTAASTAEHGMGYLFHGFAEINLWIAREIAGLAQDTLQWATWLQRSHLPRWTKALILATVPPIILALVRRAVAGLHLPHLTRYVVTKVSHTVTHEVVRIVKATAGAVAVPLPSIHIFPRLRAAERWIGRTRKQLRQLAYFTTATGAAVLVAKAFGRMGLNWLRCRNVSKVGRGICRMDLSVLNFLLGVEAGIFALAHLCDLVKIMQRAAEAFLPVLLALVDEVEGFVCGGKASLPSGIVADDGKRVARLPSAV